MQELDERGCENMSSIGDAIREERSKRGWSQEYLARKADVPTITLGNIERGTIKSPGIDKIGPIADALEVTIDYLRNAESGYDNSPNHAR